MTDHHSPDPAAPARPRWVKTAALIVAVVVLAVLAAVLIGGGEHGPGRHLPGGESGHTSPVEHGP